MFDQAVQRSPAVQPPLSPSHPAMANAVPTTHSQQSMYFSTRMGYHGLCFPCLPCRMLVFGTWLFHHACVRAIPLKGGGQKIMNHRGRASRAVGEILWFTR